LATDFADFADWRGDGAAFVLAEGVAHVWRASLERPAAQREALWQFLSADERARAERFYFERKRQFFIVGRGLLRWLNGRYLQIPPADVQFSYGEHGKPALAGERGVQFNVSHGQGKLLIGFARGAALGVDIEQIRLLDDADNLARRFFSEAENEAYVSVPPAQKGEAFFNCWTRKEAFIKAVGEGLSYPLRQFDVTLRPGEPARLLRVKGSVEDAARWSLFSLTPFPGYRGALVVAERPWTVRCWDADAAEL
jgi:4'-phosphopantetheinyl transferase